MKKRFSLVIILSALLGMGVVSCGDVKVPDTNNKDNNENNNTGGSGDNTGGDNTGGDNTGDNTGGSTGGSTGGDNTGGDNAGGSTGGDNTGGSTGGDNTGGSEGGDTTENKYDEYAKHDGSLASPYSVKECNEIISKLNDKEQSSECYFTGKVVSIQEVSTSYGNATFTIKSADSELLVWRCYSLNKAKFKSKDEVKVGDNLIMFGTLLNYGGKNETGTGTYIYSRNNDVSTSTGGDNTGGSTGGGSSGSHDIASTEKDYYKSITDSLTGGMNGTLRTTLTSISKPKKSIGYDGLKTFLPNANEDPKNPNNMIYFYTQKSVKKQSAGEWNREHTWPKSLSGGLYGTSGAGCDALHIMPTYVTTNSTRSSLKFGNCSNGKVRTYQGVNYAKTSGGYFEPMDSVKGDCARIVLYMWTTYFAERNHSITNVASSVSLMVEWHKLDPVDDIEMNRNNVVFASKQNNRNPFVDHPEWVDKIFK